MNRIEIVHRAYYAGTAAGEGYEYHDTIAKCLCGSHLVLSRNRNDCPCGRTYDHRGYPIEEDQR